MNFDKYFTDEMTAYAERFRIPRILIVRCKRAEIEKVIKNIKLRLYTSAYRCFLHKLLSDSFKEIYCEVTQKQAQAELEYGTLLCILDCHKYVKYPAPIALNSLFEVDCDFVVLLPEDKDTKVGNVIKQITEAAKAVGRKTAMVFWGDEDEEDDESSNESKEYSVSIVYRPQGNFMKMCRIIHKYSTLFSVTQAVSLFAEPVKFPITVTCISRDKAMLLIKKLEEIGGIAYMTDDDNTDEDEKVSIFLPDGIPGEKLLDLSKSVVRYSCSHRSLLYCVLHLDEGPTTLISPNMDNAIQLLCALHAEDVEAYITNDFEL